MSVRVNTRLEWDNTTPGEWKWLTFAALCDVADEGRDKGIDPQSFVRFRPEYGGEDPMFRADRLLIEDEETQ